MQVNEDRAVFRIADEDLTAEALTESLGAVVDEFRALSLSIGAVRAGELFAQAAIELRAHIDFSVPADKPPSNHS